jgi:hypothetical protein
MIWLNSDLVGIVVGTFVFLVMVCIGWATGVPLLTSVERALVGLLIGYTVGFFFSSRIRRAVARMIAEDKIRQQDEMAESKTSAEDETE